MKYKIYKITNTKNSKVYVGYTSKSLNWRLEKHFEEADKDSTSSRKLFKAINAVGKENFNIYLLYSDTNKKSTLGEKEQEYIDMYNSIDEGYNSRKGGGGIHITEGQCKKTDVYDKDGKFIKTFNSRVAVADFIGCHPASISTAIANADNGKGSQVKGYWVCHYNCKPHYKVRNTTGVATKAARIVNTGKKRPEHSEFMKKHPSKVDNNIYSFIHVSGTKFNGTRNSLIESFPSHTISSSEMGMVIRGKYKSHRGWKIKTP